MEKKLRYIEISLFSLCLTLGLLILLPVKADAATPNYTNSATATSEQLNKQPGVYYAEAVNGDNEATSTIGIPSVSRQALEDTPTTEAPAIITGAATGYETKTGPTEFTPIEGATLDAPYSEFRYNIVDEQIQNADGTINVHKKVTGFDGTYYIIRVDITNLVSGVTDTQYLHVKQEGNVSLMVLTGMGTGDDATTFSDAMGNWTGTYAISDGDSSALRNKSNSPDGKLYFDIIVPASGNIVSGANQGQAGAPSADWTLSFYIDSVQDYNPQLIYDATSTDPNHASACLAKFFNPNAYTSAAVKAGYTVKGSDLQIDVMVEDSSVTGGKPQFWSLEKAMTYQQYDTHTIKLISEVPVVSGLNLTGTADNKRDVILDVNSFDIQIANNATTGAAGLVVGDNATLTIMDGTSTAGAELAIGNNANMHILSGGTLIIDPTCVLEVEYDAASVTQGQSGSARNSGEIVVESGGTIINNGVINVEGTEGKPVDVTQPLTRDIQSAVMVINPGGILDNNGTLSVKGKLYILGCLTNNGFYNDVIHKINPDIGPVDYHRGIQITWKDDVTQPGVVPGVIYVGLDSMGNVYREAMLVNNGDIVIAPGQIELYGVLDTNKGHIYLADVTEAIIPIAPDAANPLMIEKRIQLASPSYGLLNVHEGATILGSEPNFSGAKVELIHNGVMGALTDTGEAKKNMSDVRSDDYVLSANDGIRDLVRGEDYIIHDGWVEFTDSYLESFSGKRTVRINIGYRFIYIDVEGLKPGKVTKVPKTGDDEPDVKYLICILSVLVLAGYLVHNRRRRVVD